MKAPITRGQLTLRHPVPADAEPLARLADNPGIAAWLRNRFPSPYRLPDARAFIQHCQDANDGDFHFAIERNGTLVGMVGAMVGEPGEIHHRTAEIGYWIGEPYWGEGIATGAVRALAEELLSKSHLVRLFATVFEGNHASCRVLEKAGFTKEGVMRAYVEKGGRILDAHLYALVRQ